MAKTKGGRSVNPTDAFRKEERKKQVNRNKLERKFQREAHRKLNNASSLKAELESIMVAEENGTVNKNLRLKKKVLKDAYDQALRKKQETDKRGHSFEEGDEGEMELTEDGMPESAVPSTGLPLLQSLPVPPPPPLPPGEPPMHTPGMMPSPLGPPAGPPPGFVLPPPPGPPPGAFHIPRPMYPMHSMPQGPMVSNAGTRVYIQRRTTADVVREHRPTITAASTVVKKPMAQDDKTVTSMVPASVRIKREKAQVKGGSVRKPDLAPGSSTAVPRSEIQDGSQTSMEQKMAAFLNEVEELGAFDST